MLYTYFKRTTQKRGKRLPEIKKYDRRNKQTKSIEGLKVKMKGNPETEENGTKQMKHRQERQMRVSTRAPKAK
jgi:hypothetical protein